MHPHGLNKRQRIYMRDRLHERQNGKCHFCESEIKVLTPSVQLVENWRRAILFPHNGSFVVVCQHCDSAGGDWQAEADELIGAA